MMTTIHCAIHLHLHRCLLFSQDRKRNKASARCNGKESLPAALKGSGIAGTSEEPLQEGHVTSFCVHNWMRAFEGMAKSRLELKEKASLSLMSKVS